MVKDKICEKLSLKNENVRLWINEAKFAFKDSDLYDKLR